MPADPRAGPTDCDLGTPTDCSACGDACAGSTPLCAAITGGGFECVAQCKSNETDCDGQCVNTETDVQHCNGCDTPCELANSEATCVGGVCTMGACVDPFGDCNMMPEDGCELPLTSETDCGMCGNECQGDDRCISGSCNPCLATNPSVSGNQTKRPCRIVGFGGQLRMFANQGSCQFDTILTLTEFTATGDSGMLFKLCRIVASGNTISFTDFGDTFCDVDAGSITLSGATAEGTINGEPCRILASGNSIEFFEQDGVVCGKPIGTIVLSPVCL